VVKVQGTWLDGTKQTFPIPIYAPKSFTAPKPERVLPSAADMAKVLAELPIQSLASIKEINLNPKPNKDDAILQAELPESMRSVKGRDVVRITMLAVGHRREIHKYAADGALLEAVIGHAEGK
jgi:hypothetical protein